MPPLTVNAHVIDAAPAGGSDPAALRVRSTVGPNTDFHALEQTVIELEPGASTHRFTDASEEVLFVLSGIGSLELRATNHDLELSAANHDLELSATNHDLEPESGAYLAPGEEYELSNRGPQHLTLISVRIPDPDPATDVQDRKVVRRLADQEAQAATTDREFRIVADPSTGLRSATHFVGYIPTARAPDHFHTYNEVIYVLDGEGVLHAQGNDYPVKTGSCIQLPARVVHCLHNTGDSTMRVVAVFRPAGSPAAAYYPDGTPAHPGAPPIQT